LVKAKTFFFRESLWLIRLPNFLCIYTMAEHNHLIYVWEVIEGKILYDGCFFGCGVGGYGIPGNFDSDRFLFWRGLIMSHSYFITWGSIGIS
jgi:hypothetical protein